MSLALETLVWNSDTSALERAVKEIDNLSAAVGRLSKAQAEEVKTAKQSEKAKEAEVKAAKEVAKANQTSSKASKELGESTSKLDKLVKNLENTHKDLANGMTRGESSVLNFARSLGATENQIKDVTVALKNIGSLTKNPFDASIGAVRSITQELDKTKHRADLAAQGIVLSTKQLGEYSRLATELAAKMTTAGINITQGAGLDQYNKKLGELHKEYIGIAQQVNTYTTAEKELQRQHRETGNAARALAAEDERMVSIMHSMNSGVNQTTSASQKSAVAIARYERNLRLAGVGAQEATAKLALYRKQMLQVQEIEQTRRAQHLSRALTPQISDVVTSLAGGMPAHLVIMQQGLQIRDLIALSGVEAEKLREVFKTASGDMVRSLTGTAKAIGTLLISSLVSAGKAVTDFLVAPFKVAGVAMAEFITFLKSGTASTSAISASISLLGKSFLAVSGIIAGAAVGALLAFIGVLYKTEQENNALVKALNLTGAAMGMSRDQAYQAARGFEQFGISTGTALDIITLMAQEGLRGDLTNAVVTTAKAMKDTFGVAIEDTVKKFKDLQDDPVKALIEIAKQTGNIPPQVIRVIDKLVETGDKYRAVAAAAEYARSAQVKAANDAEEELGSLATLGKEIGKIWEKTWETILNIGRTDLYAELAAAEKELLDAIGAAAEDPFDDYKQYVAEAASATVAHIKTQIAAKEATAKQKEENARLVDEFERQKKAREELTKSAVKGLTAEQERDKAKKAALDNYNIAMSASKLTTEEVNEINKDYQATLKGIDEQYKKNSGATKEANDVTKFYNKTIDDFQKMQVNASGTTDELSKAQTHLLNVMRDDKWASFTEERKLAILEEFKLAHAVETTAEAYKKQQKALDDLQKLYNKADTDISKRETDTEKQTRSLEHQISLIGKTESEVKKLNKQFKEQEDILAINTELHVEQIALLQDYTKAASQLDGEELEREAARIIARLEALQIDSANKIKNVQMQANLDVLLEQERQWNEIRDVISESIWLGMTESGKSGADYLKNYLNTVFKKFVINVLINPIVGQMTGGAGGGLSKIISAGSTGGMGGLGTLGQAGSFFGDVSGSITSILGAPATAGTSSVTAGVMGVPGGVSTGTSASGIYAGGLGSAVIPAFAGYGIAQKHGAGAGFVGGAATTALAGGIGGLASGAGFLAGAGGALAAMGPVGWVALAIGAILGGMGPNKPTNYWQGAAIDTETGLVTKTGSYDPESRRYDPVNRQVADTFGAYLGSLSQTLSRITGETIDKNIRIGVGKKDKHFTVDGVKTELKGGTNEELINMASTYLVDLVYDKLSDAAKGVVDALRDEGEKIENALVWVVEGLPELNKWLERFGVSLLDISIDGVKAAEALAELVGGVENLAGLQANYMDAFFSDAEKVLFMNADLSAAFDELGLGMVNSRDGFRELVAAQDLNTEAGRKAYAGLLSLAPAMDQYLNLLDSEVNSTEAAAKASKAYKEALSLQIKVMEESVSNLTRLSQLLHSTLDSMRLGTLEETRMRRSTAMARVSSALTTARTTGILPNAEEISPFLRTLAEPSEQLYSSFEDYERDFLLAKNDIFALAEMTDSQLTIEEKTLSWMKERAEQEVTEHEESLEQLNINNIMQEKQSELLQQIRTLLDTQGLFSKDTDPSTPIPGMLGVREQMSPETISAAQAALAGIGVTSGGAITEAQAALIYEAYKSGYAANLGVMGLSDIDQLLGQRVGTAESWLRDRGLPAFANGGDHAGGWRVVGERGPELEFTQPSHIYNGNQANSLINIQPIVDAIVDLRSDVDNLERATSAVASNTYRSARSLDEIVYSGVETTPA